MKRLEEIAEQVHAALEVRTAERDRTLARTRTLTRHCANAIRAIHREEDAVATSHIEAATELANLLRTDLAQFPDLYHAGYTQDALKEYAEASIVYAVILGEGLLPTPDDLQMESHTYMQGLAESIGEMRRRCLDILRHGHSQEVERLMAYMDDIYAVLVTMDYPSAITGGLRRLTDVMRGVIERTRGDITLSMRQEQLEKSLQAMEKRLKEYNLSG